ncbi:AMP-binding protein [Ramlibacter sp.]|uniref:AMP-binding protein n=1 Tax=Ramlibacter sp. TaxID=1917967 RepID=UPI003D0E6644
MPGWNFADIFKVVAEEIPDRPALVHGPRTLTWREIDARTGALARHLAAAGLPRQAKVAQYLYNTPEYLESLLACFRGSFVPLNTNYRYGPDELVYLWDNGDVECVVFHGCFVPTIEQLRARVPRIRHWLWVDDGHGPCPAWATPYETAARDAQAPPVPWQPDGDDLILVYTGGTTGMPKGVMWRQDDLFMRLNTERGDDYPDTPDLDFVRRGVGRNGRAHLSAAPLMHGAGLLTCFLVLARGGFISHLEKRSFDPVDLLDTVQRDRVASLMWVGDAFARPVLAALDAQPARWDLSSLRTIMSSGVVFSAEVKQALLRHLPRVTISDIFGSTESMSLGRNVTTGGEAPATATATFKAKADTRVVDENGTDVVPGSGVAGLLAIGGRQALGYYGDTVKTATVFRMLDGKRFVIPGDWATVDADGTVQLLGRGSGCINTGGEKVFPEEVETVLKEHPDLYDAVVVGIPDLRFGQAVVAIVEPNPDARVDGDELVRFVKSRMAAYKAPKHVLVKPIDRGPNAKPDLKALQAWAAARVCDPTPETTK